MNLLVIAAHPDDEVLGAGGLIAKALRQGRRADVLLLGEGATSRVGADAVEVDRLKAQAAASALVLGGAGVEHLGLPDNRFDTVPLLDVVHAIEERIERLQPDVVVTQHGGDVNIDHQTSFRAVLAATRPVPGHRVRTVMAYEVASSTEWAFGRQSPVFCPNLFVDISDELDIKLDALRCYEDELRPFPHPRSIEGVTAQATRWGTAVGVRAAEAFEIVRAIR